MLSIDDVNRLEPENEKLKKQLGFAKKAIENVLYCLKTKGEDDPNGNCTVKEHAVCTECQAIRLEQVLAAIEELENGDKNDKKD